MCYDYTIAHRKFQATRYILVGGIIHFRKHLSESQIAKHFFEVFVSDVMAYNNVLFPIDDFGMRSSRHALAPVVLLCQCFVRNISLLK